MIHRLYLVTDREKSVQKCCEGHTSRFCGLCLQTNKVQITKYEGCYILH